MEAILDFDTITPCGECCIGCKKRKSGFCGGCIETDGHCKEWEESGGCPIFRCCKEHQARFCGLCKVFPCPQLTEKIPWNTHIVADLTLLRDAYRR